MELFEYLTAAVSIVLALAVVRLVEGLRPALGAERRYWVHFLVPRDPAGIASWREHFRSIQRPFYLANALYLAYLAIIPVVFVAEPMPTPASAVLALGCTLSLVAAFWDSPRVQELIAVVMFAMISLSATTLIFDPIVVAQG